jgi:hypothetical protein
MTAKQRRKKNRQNATRSTEPITPEGKEASRANAVKSGLTAKTLALPGEDPDAVQAKAQRWHKACQPKGHDEEVLVDQMALAALRLERIARAEDDILAEQVRNAEIAWDLEQGRRLLSLKRLLRRDRTGAILELRSFGVGVAWLLGRWKVLESAFNASQCWKNLGLIREAILIRGVHDDRLDAQVGSGYEFAHLAISCVDGHENIPELVHFLEKYDDEGVPCIDRSKDMKEFLTSMASYIPDEYLARGGVRALSLAEARRTMRSWIDRQIADLRELDRHFREADAKSRAGAKIRALAPADSPQNRLLMRYMKSAENAIDRTVKTLAKLQKDRQKAAETEAKREPSEVRKMDSPNEPKVVARPHSKDLMPGGCVTIRDDDYVIVEKSDGNLILSLVAPLIKEKPQGVASPSENAV